VAIAGIDTRRLTRVLRTKGAQNGCITSLCRRPQHHAGRHRRLPWPARQGAPSMAGPGPGPGGVNQPYEWTETEWALGSGYGTLSDAALPRRGLRLRRQAQHPAHAGQPRLPRHRGAGADARRRGAGAAKPDGIFLSNGPGDPEPCDYAIAAARTLIDTGIPTFGICLGHQIMALASGAKTFKMKFGHHGANHPVKDLDTGRVSSPARTTASRSTRVLAAQPAPTHVSLFDGTLQGLARTDRPAFCFQGHPEASPGPHDIAYLFDRFVKLME
jgi:carbamoyl-phosphate synthase small subunit